MRRECLRERDQLKTVPLHILRRSVDVHKYTSAKCPEHSLTREMTEHASFFFFFFFNVLSVFLICYQTHRRKKKYIVRRSWEKNMICTFLLIFLFYRRLIIKWENDNMTQWKMKIQWRIEQNFQSIHREFYTKFFY